MSRIHHLCAALLVVGGLSVAPGIARAAESYDNCTGFIDSVPATIGTQGTWCLRKHLATAITSGNAITLATNNVTVDCNDFKLGGLAAGDSSLAIGIHAEGRHNVTVRQCGIRGFYAGISLQGNGHLVEDNRLDNNLVLGVGASGDDILVRRNRVFDTGGAPESPFTVAMAIDGDAHDNIVSGVFAIRDDAFLRGIQATGAGTRIHGNTLRGLAHTGTQDVIYIQATVGAVLVDRNHLWSTLPRLTSRVAIRGTGDTTSCIDNNVVGFHQYANFQSCFVSRDNHAL